MTSILTNQGAMVALQTLRGINNDPGTVQEQISTGKKVGTAKDNAAVWAISKVMEADVSGFGKVAEGLAVVESTVAVARDASETVSDLLRQARDKIVQAQDPAQDGAKIQADISSLTDQIRSVVGSAQFSGVNLLDGSSGGAAMDVLGSLNHGADGVTSGMISVERQDLRVDGLEKVATADLATFMDVAATPILAGGSTDVTIGTIAEGNVCKLTIGDVTKSFTATADDTADSMAAKIAGAFTNGDMTSSVTGGMVTFTNNIATDAVDVAAEVYENTGGAGGGLAGLATIDVTTVGGAQDALEAIDALLTTAIDAAAAFGPAQNQLDTQGEFISKFSDTMKAGIGSMVDADMEEASARLKALQTQQQLGIQSLSIANQAPSSVMALFR